MAEDVETNAYIHFVDERDLLTTELSDYNNLCFETCILEGTSSVTDRILYRMANGVDKYDLSDFNKRILGFLCGIKI